MSLLVYLYHK